MIETLQILLIIFSSILLMKFVVGIVLYKLYNHDLFKILIGMWGFSIVNFVSQAIFIDPGMAKYISFSTYIMVSLHLYFFANKIVQRQLSTHKMIVACSLFFALGIVGFLFTNNYTIGCAMASIAIAIPLVTSSYHLWNSGNGSGPRALSILLFLNAVHFMNYPVIQLYPSGALWGFSITLTLLFAFSSFFPGYILMQNANKNTLGLEEEVKNRTKELEEAFDQNKILVNILCHDLSTPLTVLDFYFDEIMDEKASEVHTVYGAKAQRSLQSMLNIVAKVKDLQAVGYGKKTIETKKINLAEVIKEIIADFENSLQPKELNINFKNSLDSNVVILGDMEILKNQIFSNLISNAIKFSYKGSVIDISINEEQKNINVTIEDHGMGIPDELLPNLFKWKEKTNRTGTNGERGTGLGLPLVKNCVDMIGAKIRVETTLSEAPDSKSGSKFIVQFDKVA